MGNRGQITVFTAGVMAVLMLVIPPVIRGIDIMGAREMAYEMVRTAESNIKAGYNRYIFDEYHILLIDKECGGRGEAMLLEMFEDNLRANASDAFDISNIQLSGYTRIMDDDLAPFIDQVEECAGYEAAMLIVDNIKKQMTETGPEDSDYEDMDLAYLLSEEGEEPLGEDDDFELTDGLSTANSKSDDDMEERKEVKDPRKEVGTWAKIGIANLIKPDGVVYSDEAPDVKELPSYGHFGIAQLYTIDADFDDYLSLRSESRQIEGLGEGLKEYASGLVYVSQNSGNALRPLEGHVFNMEQEYILGGFNTDKENFNYAVNQILAIRFAANFGYIITDTDKEAEAEEAATAILFEVPYLIDIGKYLILAAWAYAESVCDAYRLVRKARVTFVKNSSTWTTDLESLGNFQTMENAESDDTGLTYDDYMMLLMALNINKVYYRMLDLMQLNAVKAGYHGFSMKNAITEFAINVTVSYGNADFYIREEAGY